MVHNTTFKYVYGKATHILTFDPAPAPGEGPQGIASGAERLWLGAQFKMR